MCLGNYIDKLIDSFGLSDANAAKTEDTIAVYSDETKLRSLVGGPLYIAVCTMPGIAVSRAILGCKVSAPIDACWVATKRVVRHLKASKHWN